MRKGIPLISMLAAALLLAGCVTPTPEGTATPVLKPPPEVLRLPTPTPTPVPTEEPTPTYEPTATAPPGGLCEITRTFYSDVTSSSAQITWFTNRRAQSSITWEIPGVPDSGSTLRRVTYDLEHFFRLEYLQAGATYYYYVESCCEKDNCATDSGAFATFGG